MVTASSAMQQSQGSGGDIRDRRQSHIVMLALKAVSTFWIHATAAFDSFLSDDTVMVRRILTANRTSKSSMWLLATALTLGPFAAIAGLFARDFVEAR
jgi:hypothetical protein